LDSTDYSHIRKVLRLSQGDQIIIFNGEKEYLAELKTVSRDAITARIVEVLKQKDFSVENHIDLYLFQSLPKAGKMDLIIEKTSEIGVDYITPFTSEFSLNDADKANLKLDRWNRISLSASKQSGRITVPQVYPCLNFDHVVGMKDEFDLMIIFSIINVDQSNSSLENLKLENIIQSTEFKIGKCSFLIGPEGGFSPNELKKAKELKIPIVQIFENVLRTETASIAITSIMRFLIDKRK
jgi:16S rRNA (uracil1498-N3)-methyltransferase